MFCLVTYCISNHLYVVYTMYSDRKQPQFCGFSKKCSICSKHLFCMYVCIMKTNKSLLN